MPSKKKLICVEKYKTIYAPVPKAANSSMKSILADLVKRDPHTKSLPTHQGYWSDATCGETCLVDPKFALKRKLDGWFVFTILRNPFDRLVSCYNNKIIENPKVPLRMAALGYSSGMSFDKFVEVLCMTSDRNSDNHTVSQHYILTSGNKLIVNFAAKFENITQDYTYIQERLAVQSGVKIEDLPRNNVRRSSGADYMSFYRDPEVLQDVFNRYRKDFDLFYPEVAGTLGISRKISPKTIYTTLKQIIGR